jgi:hypothetical protein
MVASLRSGVTSCVHRPRSYHPTGWTLEDFGARAGCAWRETDEADTDFETIVRDVLSGQYAYPLRIVAFNPIDGWSRDATEEIADELAHRVADQAMEISPALQAFIEANATRPVSVQLALPLRKAD